MRIACLHTAESNVAIFEAARPEGVSLSHVVRPDLLAAAEVEGLTADVAAATVRALNALGERADAVLLTCSTLGPAAAGAGALRADAALAEAATSGGGMVEVLCTAPSTLAATAELFGAAAERSGAQVMVNLVPDAWELFHAGDLAAYADRIAREADASQSDTVVLAQASMAPAAKLTVREVLTCPAVALAAAARAEQR
jgi:hypothetical protein